MRDEIAPTLSKSTSSYGTWVVDYQGEHCNEMQWFFNKKEAEAFLNQLLATSSR